MRNVLFFLFLGLSLLQFSYAQTTATDFNVNDCDGNPHHLFSELDNGKVIVMVWVMPCGPCATHALAAYAAVQTYANSHPDRVKFYMVDDYANTTCNSLQTWASTYSMGSCTKFSNQAISMSDYGQNGMPKTVVIGGANHTVYFNENSSTQGIEVAIDQALTGVSTNIFNEKNNMDITLFPNPAKEEISISFNGLTSPITQVEMFNILGELNHSELLNQMSSSGIYTFDISKLPSGPYFIKLTNSSASKVIKFSVIQ